MRNNGLIVTQYPPLGDAVDFLRLILDNKSDTIICMDPLSEIQSVSAISMLQIIIDFLHSYFRGWGEILLS